MSAMAAALPFPKSDATGAEAGWQAAAGGRTHQGKTILAEVKVIPEVKAEPEVQAKVILDISGVFRGRELTRKERRLTCGIAPIDQLIGGGIVRGRVSEIIGKPGAGRTSLAAAFAASSTSGCEVAAWIDAAGSFDPESMAAAGVDLARLLWVAMPANHHRAGEQPRGDIASQRPESRRTADYSEHYVANHDVAGRSYYTGKRSASTVVLKAAEWILAAGGFGLVVIDCGGLREGEGRVGGFTQSAALRLARGAERSGTAVVVIGAHQLCGTFAAMSLRLSRRRAGFSRAGSGAPVLFDGLTIEARVMRNKLGGSGDAAIWRALAEPAGAATPASAMTSEAALGIREAHASRESANHVGQRVAAR